MSKPLTAHGGYQFRLAGDDDDRAPADKPAALQVPLHEQLRELEREATQRAKAYPLMVTRRQITQRAADQQMAALNAAIATVRALERARGASASSALEIEKVLRT